MEFEIRKCNPEKNPKDFCHKEEEIENWLSHSSIETWYIQKQVDMNKYHQEPTYLSVYHTDKRLLNVDHVQQTVMKLDQVEV